MFPLSQHPLSCMTRIWAGVRIGLMPSGRASDAFVWLCVGGRSLDIACLRVHTVLEISYLFTFSLYVLCTPKAVAAQLLQFHVKALCHKSQLGWPL